MYQPNWTTWFISDIHFGHANAIVHTNRPFKDIDEMKETIISNWNKVVKPKDLCIFVGDIFFYHSKNQMVETMGRMNGRKVLVRGNHDQKPRQMMNAGFEICVEEMSMKIADEKVLISHYPFAMPEKRYRYLIRKNKFLRWITGKSRQIYPYKYHERRPVDRGQFLIHGHTHNKDKVRGRAIHVGVDAWDFRPINIQEISNLIARIKQNEKNRRQEKTVAKKTRRS